MTSAVADPEWWQRAYRGPVDLAPLDFVPDLRAAQVRWRSDLAERLYGPIPPAPDNLQERRQPLPNDDAERVTLSFARGDRRFSVDAALWLPDAPRPAPLIVGLDFVGPAGVLTSDAFPLDPEARIYSRPEHNAGNRMTAALRGTQANRWPVRHLTKAGYAVLLSCYGSWAPDDPDHMPRHGVAPLMAGAATGAISLWAWALSRMIDASMMWPEIDATRIAAAGHSRLGKAALWAASNDQRIKAVFANQSGAAGSAPAAHPIGETLDQLDDRFPHWTMRQPGSGAPSLDQHALLASIAPRAVYLGGATEDLWADPVGSALALQAAAPAWDIQDFPIENPSLIQGPIGYRIREGDHDLTPEDWAGFLDFLTDLGWSDATSRESP